MWDLNPRPPQSFETILVFNTDSNDYVALTTELMGLYICMSLFKHLE